jgi:hypothetical protein
MKHLLAIAAVFGLCGFSAVPAVASNPNGTGQPSQTCLTANALIEPGNAAGAPGSAFNETDPGVAGTMYAGSGMSTSTPANDHAVSQYDVACYQVSQHH